MTSELTEHLSTAFLAVLFILFALSSLVRAGLWVRVRRARFETRKGA